MIDSSLPSLDTLRGKLRENAPNIEARFGLRIAGIVGSFARGEARPDSDIDILVERCGDPSLFDLDALETFLTDIFGRRTDIIVRSGLPPHWRDFADGELVAA